MDPTKDYYDILGVSPEADGGDIKEAYRDLAKKYHPDHSDEPNAEEKFKEIQEAHDVLGDRDKRREYDMQRGGGDPFSGGDPFDMENMSGEFGERIRKAREMFEEHVGPDFGNRHTQHRNDPQKAPDFDHTVQLKLSEVPTGHTVEVTSPEDELIEVDIPPGISSGQLIRVPGKGYSIDGIPRGDMIVRVQITNDTEFRRDGKDLYKTVRANPFECMIGTEIETENIHGETIRFEIPELTGDGETFRVPGQGIGGEPATRGDMYCRIRHEIHGGLTPRQKELLESLAELERIKTENS